MPQHKHHRCPTCGHLVQTLPRALTPPQAELLAFIAKRIAWSGLAPTRREMREEMGVSSPRTMERHLKALIAKGYLNHEPNQRRGLTLAA